MSFDMYVAALRDDSNDRFDRSIVEEAFRPYVEGAIADDYWNFRDADGHTRHLSMSVDVQQKLENFSCNRPPDFETFPEFWEGLYNVLRRINAILFWPSVPFTYCVASPRFVDQVPADFIADNGKPIFVKSAVEMYELVEKTR